jgi:hypothetical protein
MKAEKIIDDLCLIDNVVVNYSQGRRRGLTDEETEDRALKAVSLAMEILEKEVPKKPTIKDWSPARCPNCDEDMTKRERSLLSALGRIVGRKRHDSTTRT